jgi:hypothetical protein
VSRRLIGAGSALADPAGQKSGVTRQAITEHGFASTFWLWPASIDAKSAAER